MLINVKEPYKQGKGPRIQKIAQTTASHVTCLVLFISPLELKVSSSVK